MASWFLSPILTMSLTFVLFMAMCYLTLGGRGISEDYPEDAFLNEERPKESKKLSFNAKLIWLTIISGMSLTLISQMVLILTGSSENNKINKQLLPLTFLAGVLLSRVVIYKSALEMATQNNIDATRLSKNFATVIFKVWTTELINEVMSQNLHENTINLGLINEDKPSKGIALTVREEHKMIAEVYKYLMLCAELMVCLAFGANVVASQISPMALVFGLHSIKNVFTYLIGSLGLSLGLIMLGHRVMKTVGKQIVKLDYQKGFAAQFSAAFGVILATMYALPLSTNQCIVGSLFGIILANRQTMVQRVYSKDNFATAEVNSTQAELPFIKSNSSVIEVMSNQNFPVEAAYISEEKTASSRATIKKIVTMWAITVPTACVLSYVCTQGTIYLSA